MLIMDECTECGIDYTKGIAYNYTLVQCLCIICPCVFVSLSDVPLHFGLNMASRWIFPILFHSFHDLQIVQSGFERAEEGLICARCSSIPYRYCCVHVEMMSTPFGRYTDQVLYIKVRSCNTLEVSKFELSFLPPQASLLL